MRKATKPGTNLLPKKKTVKSYTHPTESVFRDLIRQVAACPHSPTWVDHKVANASGGSSTGTLSPPRIIDTGTRSPNIAEAMENSSVFSWDPWDPSKMGPVDFPQPWIFSHFVQPRYMVNMVSNCQDNGKHTFSASRAPGQRLPSKSWLLIPKLGWVGWGWDWCNLTTYPPIKKRTGLFHLQIFGKILEGTEIPNLGIATS